MTIGIDARLIDETGVGRYIKNLISHLSVIDTTNSYVVFLTEKAFSSFMLPNARWKKVEAGVRWHTLKEQFVMPRLFAREHCDLVHIPYHNPPIWYFGPMVLTIHDLIILHFDTGNATTLPVPLYKLKRLGYFIELWIGLRKAKRIIAVSEATKQEIVDHFGINPEKITVTYEGVDEHILATHREKSMGALGKIIEGRYVLYVGNAYPHKNLDTLLAAFVLLRKKKTSANTKLVLVGNDDFFIDIKPQRPSLTTGLIQKCRIAIVRSDHFRIFRKQPIGGYSRFNNFRSVNPIIGAHGKPRKREHKQHANADHRKTGKNGETLLRKHPHESFCRIYTHCGQ